MTFKFGAVDSILGVYKFRIQNSTRKTCVEATLWIDSLVPPGPETPAGYSAVSGSKVASESLELSHRIVPFFPSSPPITQFITNYPVHRLDGVGGSSH